MKRPFLAGLLALGGLGLAVACKDVARPDATGSIALHVTIPSEPAASGPARSPAQPAGHLTSATASVTGPTSKTLTLTAGTSNFTGTITGLAPGSYTVTVQGLVGTEVDYYGQTTGLSVTSGATANAVINFQSFIPTLNAFPTLTTWSFRPTVTLTTVPNATSYVIEVDRSNTFPNPVKTTVTSATGASFAVSDTGTHYVRVRAANTSVPNGGRVSATQTIRITTDQRTSGNDFASALSLGFVGTITTRTLDSLNIFPSADTDWFALSECNGDSVTVTAQAVRLSPPSPLNTTLAVFSGATGRLIAGNADADSTDARLRMLLMTDGTYKLAVAGNGSTVGHYKLVVQIKPGANNTGSACKVQPLAVSTVTGGLYHTCALRSGGIVDCWGRNIYGEVGNGTSANAISSPVRVSGAQTWQGVGAGGLHTCGFTSAGTAYCWGRNGNGQLGNGTTIDATSPVAVSGGRTYQRISGGSFHTCAVTTGGRAYCWGSNLNGKLGDGTTTASSTPDSVATSLFFQAIGAGDQHTCGLTTTGGVYCWGDNFDGQLGNGTNTDNSLPVLVGSGYTALAVGGYHACALTTTGSVNCWGYGVFGQLGNNAFNSSNSPVLVAGSLTFSSIAAGRYTTCGVAGGVTYCWGDNFDGEVGDNTTIHRALPTAVSGGVAFQSLGLGGFHSCGVQTTTGNSYCWGWNGFGQLGDGGGYEQTGPVVVSGLTSVAKISTGNEHTCAVTTGGSPYCWGWNAFGQLGDGSFTDRGSAALVSGGLVGNFTQIAAGQEHSCTLRTSDGVTYCWGDNSDGQLGDGTSSTSELPVMVTGNPSPFTAISVGDWHSCGLGQNGLVYCWGDNVDGQLGNGSTTDAMNPVQISSALTFKQVSAGGALTCALTTTNLAYCWGDNSSGGVGNGTTSGTPVTIPTAVQTPTGVTFSSISAGYDFACAVSTTGSGYCWGNNVDGQLGNNSTTESSTPVQVSGGLSWKVISASRTSGACGITSADALRCWGNNFTGQLGDGSFNNTASPAPVLTALLWQWVQAGDVHTCGVSAGLAYCWGNDERGELGRGSATGIRKTPGQVLVGPASVPILASASFSPSGAVDGVVDRPDEASGAASLERVKPTIRRKPR